MGSTEFSVSWKDHSSTLTAVCKNLLEDNFLVDCTIAAEGQCLSAHRLILSACSPYFQLLFSQQKEKHPILVLKDVKFDDIKALIVFIYHGQVQISEERLEAFLDVAESLQIKGLNDRRGQKVGSTSSDSSSTYSKDHFSSGATGDHQSNPSKQEKQVYKEEETGISALDTHKNTSHQYDHHSDVFKGLVKSNSSLVDQHSGSTYSAVKSTCLDQQRALPYSEEIPSDTGQFVKTEQFPLALLEPKCEQMEDSGNNDSDPDTSENYIPEIDEAAPPRASYQQNVNQYSGVPSSYGETAAMPLDNMFITSQMAGHSNSQGVIGAARLSLYGGGKTRAHKQKAFQPHTRSEEWFDEAGHMPVRSTSRRCALCSTAAQPHRTRWSCETCEVGLCMTETRNCYARYHKPD